MRPGQNQKRRNNGRPNQHGGGGQHGGGSQGVRRFQNNGNRSYDSNGPDVKVRGTAAQVYEKYQALARDAHSSGDNIMTENYLQHAEHYYRLMNVSQGDDGQQNRSQQRRDFGPDFGEQENEAAIEPQRQQAPAPVATDIGNEQPEFAPPAFLQQPAAPQIDPNGPQPEIQAPQFGGNRFANRGRDRFQPRRPRQDGDAPVEEQPAAVAEAPAPAAAYAGADEGVTPRRPVLGRPRLNRQPAGAELALDLPAPVSAEPAAEGQEAAPRRRVGRPRRIKTEVEPSGQE